MMQTFMFFIVYILIEFLNYGLFYSVVFMANLSRKISRWILCACVLLIFHCFIAFSMGTEASYALILISMFLFPIILIRPFRIKYLLLYPFIALSLSALGIFVSFIFSLFTNTNEYMFIQGDWYTALCQAVSILFLIPFYIERKRKKEQNYEVHLSVLQYIVFYIVVICLFWLLASIQSIAHNEDISSTYISIIGCSASIASITLIFITLWQSIVINRNMRLEAQDVFNQRSLTLQKEYYNKLLAQDEKLRHFRHDFHAHMIMLQSLSEKKDSEKIQNYLNTIINESAVNAIGHYITSLLPAQLEIDDFDLCTIVWNLLQNAIEACDHLGNTMDMKITLVFGIYHSAFYMSIQNPVDENYNFDINHIKSTKSDQESHGIGIQNVTTAIEKYHGLLEFSCQSGIFSVEVHI